MECEHWWISVALRRTGGSFLAEVNLKNSAAVATNKNAPGGVYLGVCARLSGCYLWTERCRLELNQILASPQPGH